jgi:putative transcriptional regulator
MSGLTHSLLDQLTGGRSPWRCGLVVTVVLLFGMSVPGIAEEPDRLNAILLVARPTLADPSFAESVVLVMNNLGPAPVGIIVNRPTRVSVSHLFPENPRIANLPERIYFGGPVDVGQVWFLFRARTPPAHSVRAFDDFYLSGDRELLVKLLARDQPMEDLRIFVGYSGWAPGQLEAEIERGDWTSRRANKDAIFDRKLERTWPSEGEPSTGT